MLLKACLNGSRRRGEHRALPVTPKDDDGADTLDAGRVGGVVSAVRAAVPGLPVGVTTGAWALPDVDERLAARLLSRLPRSSGRPGRSSRRGRAPEGDRIPCLLRTVSGAG